MVKGRSTLVIFIGIIAIGAFIWFQEGWRARTSIGKIDRLRLFNLDADSLLSIEFGHSNGVVRCVKEHGEWFAGDGEGNRGRADEALLQRLVSHLNSLGKGTTITTKELSIRGLDSSEYGFDDPSVAIAAVDNQGRHEWLLGRKAPLGDMVYAKIGGRDDIFTVSDKILSLVPATHEQLRDHELFPGESAAVRRLEVRGSAGFVQLVREPQAGWRLQQPVAAQADVNEVEVFLQQLYRLRIDRFVADNVSDFSVYGLQGETRQISVGAGDGSSRMLVIGDDVPERTGFVYARHADDTSVFTVSADILKLLNMQSDRFRDAHVLALPPERISSIDIAKGTEQLSLAFDPVEGWWVTRPVVWKADSQKVSDLLILWANAVVTEYNVQTNHVASEWMLAFGDSSIGGSTNRIDVMPSGGRRDGLLIRRDNDPALFQINLPSVPDMLVEPLYYKDRNVWSFSQEQVGKVALQKSMQPLQVVERGADQVFAPVSTNGSVRINNEAFSRFLRKLEHLETTGYIAYNPRDLEIYGLAKPVAELHIGLSGTNRLGQVLMIGHESADGYYSMVKGRDVVFYLPKPVVDILTADLVDTVAPVAVPSE